MKIPYHFLSDNVSSITGKSTLLRPPQFISHLSSTRHPNQVAPFVSPNSTASTSTRSSICIASHNKKLNVLNKPWLKHVQISAALNVKRPSGDSANIYTKRRASTSVSETTLDQRTNIILITPILSPQERIQSAMPRILQWLKTQHQKPYSYLSSQTWQSLTMLR